MGPFLPRDGAPLPRWASRYKGSFAPALLNILLLHALCVRSALQYPQYIMHFETKELKSFLRGEGGGLIPLADLTPLIHETSQ